MSDHEPLAVTAAPVVLRLVVAITFLWAGLGKVQAPLEVQGQQAALLADMGVGAAQDAALVPDGDTASSDGYTADQFPDPVELRRVHGLALLIHNSAFPPPAEDGAPLPAIWPGWAAEGSWPLVFGWAAAITEIIIGLLCVVGFLTRIAGLLTAGIMLNAMWLTQIGPAMQTGDTMLGFLPDYGLWSVGDWQPLLWQFSLLGIGLALAFTGGGSLSLDRSARREDDEFAEDDEEE